MNLHTLKPAQGAVHKEKRLGRGEASGKGGTATKGNKGAQSNTGYSSKRGHEGGQMPIQRRLPKRGFVNNNRIEYKVFNIGQLEQIIEKYGLQEFSLDTLYMNGLINKTAQVKVLGHGELKSKVSLKVNAISEKAKQAIETAGGSVELV
ncbi:50S ribosomal protein L15 [uncultured Chitinophaga sp.]|uniref:50S ribosomal protein L15 n=1 Tax=uncultured Chitinophaga sp. TaxID=339340 RepID=UPI0025CE6EF1|nr:50S ribosomal protein L15 [uncultured Chitinophaga sp.]